MFYKPKSIFYAHDDTDNIRHAFFKFAKTHRTTALAVKCYQIVTYISVCFKTIGYPANREICRERKSQAIVNRKSIIYALGFRACALTMLSLVLLGFCKFNRQSKNHSNTLELKGENYAYI